jgi:CheY-like chemotaxis protein
MKADVVILDIQMPEFDGYEVCRRIKSKERTKDIVVIAIKGKRAPNMSYSNEIGGLLTRQIERNYLRFR